MEKFTTPSGLFQLSRYPSRKKDLLRAWDAADEYLLNWFSAGHNQKTKLNILIINDGFGALSVALANYNVTVWTDSWLALQAIQKNLSQNEIPAETIQIINSTQTPAGVFDVVLIKVPKNLAMLEDQLARLTPLIDLNSKITAAGMVKTIHRSTLRLFEKYIGSTSTSLARKKARLIHSLRNENIRIVKSPYPKSYILEGSNYSIVNNANVFSHESLDIGTRFFLQHIPQSDKYRSIIDLGCGNGVIGLISAGKNPQAEIIFIDESYMAITSAKINFQAAFNRNRKAHFQVTDCLTSVAENSADLILNNPPFHQMHAVDDDIAWKMFRQSKKVLKLDGELWVIGNRHLAYHVKLKKLFGNCVTIASNTKFVIFKSVKMQ